MNRKMKVGCEVVLLGGDVTSVPLPIGMAVWCRRGRTAGGGVLQCFTCYPAVENTAHTQAQCPLQAGFLLFTSLPAQPSSTPSHLSLGWEGRPGCCSPNHCLASSALPLWLLCQVPRAHQKLWPSTKSPTPLLSCPGDPEQTTTAPSRCTWCRPGPPSRWGGRRWAQVSAEPRAHPGEQLCPKVISLAAEQHSFQRVSS